MDAKRKEKKQMRDLKIVNARIPDYEKDCL